jgi:Putative Flp pilus-assembly TadE/G-like
MTMALALPLLVGVTGLGVETGLWYTQKRLLQTAADAAAGAAALDRAAGGQDTQASLTQTALHAAAKNGFSNTAPNTFTLNWPPKSGSSAGQTSAVEVVLTQPQTPIFASLFLSSPVPITARAAAQAKVTGQACVLALDPSASGAVTNGGTAAENFAGCVIAANSTSPSAISFQGNPTVTAQSLWTSGGYSVGGSVSLTLSSPPTTYAWPLTDPYANLVIPGFSGCTMSNAKFQNTTQTISPGVYCGGIDFGAKANITLNPGTYYIDKGNITINAQATVTGNGVTFVLTSSGAASQIGTVTINGGATVNLSAPSDPTATFQGVTFFQDRRADTSGVDKINGGSSMNIGGAIYFPAQTVQFNGNDATAGPRCTIIVARLITFTGNSSIVDTGCQQAGVTPVQVTGVKFSE